ncbi:MAG: 4Fe-4S dicluster domain-containing protein [Oligoflexia bacterium]|nr:4Fe-4S dicluster domain-containing protein [Oligoflexia bacterium]
MNRTDANIGENILERMRADLKRALDKPVEDRRWAMAIDLEKCVGCNACTVSCIAENALPPGVVYRPVTEEVVGEYPHARLRWLPRPCMQCEEPPCVNVCPVSATWRRPDGIVVIDYDACIGCRYCIVSCPYQARTFDFGEEHTDLSAHPGQPYEIHRPAFENGVERQRIPHSDKSPVGNARKCTYCVNRLEAGMLPSCTNTCIGGATYFGDLSDSHALIAELAGSPRVMHLKEELGTSPRTFYLS